MPFLFKLSFFKLSFFNLFIFSLISLNLSCSGNEEQKKLGEAQACLDRIPQSDPSSAINCYSYISSVSSPQADSLRCSIAFLVGGITTTKLINAIKQIDDGNNAEEVFMSLLVFNGINPNNTLEPATGEQSRDNVNLAKNYCNASGVKGFMYLANFAVAGTALVRSFKANADDTFWRNPEFTTGEVEAGLEDCVNGTTTCDPADVGAAILVLGESYCIGKQDDKQCQQVEAAITAGAGDPNAIGDAFYKELYCSKDENKSKPECTN